MKIFKSSLLMSVAIITACVVAAVGIVVFSNRLTDDIRKQAKTIGELYSGVTKSIVNENAMETKVGDTFLNLLQKNDFVPVVIISYEINTDSIFDEDHRNLIYGRADSTLDKVRHKAIIDKAIAEIKSNNDSINVISKVEAKEMGLPFYMTLYYGEPRIMRNVTYITIMEVFVILMLVTIIVMRIISARREKENIWKSLALETAHQIGTPVGGLMGWIDLIKDGYPDKDKIVEGLEEDTDRLKQVADRYQNLGRKAKIENGHLMEELKKVGKYIDGRTPKGVTVSFVAPDGDVSVPHDKTLIGWAVENICKNAADAMKDSPTGSITITLRRDSRGAVIDIADTGKGMTQATMSHIFDQGFTTKPAGWGLGLALTRRIVREYHHGKVFVASSTPGKGTTFRILLPAQLTVNK